MNLTPELTTKSGGHLRPRRLMPSCLQGMYEYISNTTGYLNIVVTVEFPNRQ